MLDLARMLSLVPLTFVVMALMWEDMPSVVVLGLVVLAWFLGCMAGNESPREVHRFCNPQHAGTHRKANT